jgi:hypothetical protein
MHNETDLLGSEAQENNEHRSQAILTKHAEAQR